MDQTSLLRPEGLVQSLACTYVAVAAGRDDHLHRRPERSGRRRDFVGGDDVAAQTQQVMKNLHVALAAAGKRPRTW